MNTEVHEFKVGSFECATISDGMFTYAPPLFPLPAAFLFANAPPERLAEALREHGLQIEDWSEWVSPYICLTVDTGEHRILVDTGANGLAPSTGRLVHNMRAHGVAPEDIDTVILTHGHPDHIGGNTDDHGKPAFPNARYVMWKNEWEFWTSQQAGLRIHGHKEILLETARKNLPPIEDRLELVDRESEIVPGIRAIAAPGHTPGHMAVAVSSRGDQLLCVGDALLHPVHAEQPGWHAAGVDLDPEQVVATRRRLLNEAEVDGASVLAFHFPFPGLGRIAREGRTWKWQPIEPTG